MNGTLSNIFDNAFHNVISDYKAEGYSNDEIADRLNEDKINDALEKLIETATSDCFSYLTDKIYEIEHQRTIEINSFLAHQNEIWGNCFSVSEAMYDIAIEAAEEYSKYVNEKVSDDKKVLQQYTFLVLQYIHGRCCQEYLEIIHLLRFGFADCAYARWRSMFELCCIACFIKKHGEIIAKRFFDDSQKDKCKWSEIVHNKEGKKISSFNAIMKDCDIDESLKTQYKIACLLVHGSPQGTFKRLCLKDERNAIIVGPSDYGIDTPAKYSANCLQWITSIFLTLFPNIDSLVHIRVLQQWAEKIRISYNSTVDNCF